LLLKVQLLRLKGVIVLFMSASAHCNTSFSSETSRPESELQSDCDGCTSHSKDASFSVLDGGVQGDGDAEAEHTTQVFGLDDAVIP